MCVCVCKCVICNTKYIRRETMGLEVGVSSLGGKGRNYRWAVVKCLGMMKIQ